MPDRVIDAPIPERVPERWKWLYVDPKGSDVLDLHFKQVLREIGTAEEAVARLEAEKMEVWNAAIDEAADTLETTSALYAKRVRRLSKPTAAKQGEVALCKCGHGQSIHEFEDDGATSCCMAKVWTSSVGAGEPTPCMCPGFKEASPSSANRAEGRQG